jgi:hypothetical protein
MGGRRAARLARLACTSVVIALAACTGAGPGRPSTPPPPPAVAISAPEWRPNDRWVYDWTSGTQTGTKTIEVVEEKTINTVPYFILRLDGVQHYYTRELHWAAAIRESRVEARMVPPQPWFMWPLAPDRRWEHRGTFEDRNGRSPFNDRFSVVGLETVEVPAGRFQAMKVVRQSDRRDSDEYWYASDVRWYVRWLGRRGDATFEERLKEYQPGRR